MPTIEAEPLVIAFKREVAKMRDRDAPDIEIQAMLEPPGSFCVSSVSTRPRPPTCWLTEAWG